MKNTLILKTDATKPDLAKIRIAAEMIKKGQTVAFPTETVYGLGADALNPEAVMELFRAKKRPLDNPPIVHVSRAKETNALAVVPANAKILMRNFWPGPLTLIFKRSAKVPDVTVAGLDTIAVRMPKHNVALTLIRESGRPIAAPSANLAGRPSPTSAEHVLQDLNGRIDAVLDAGPTKIGVESTVLDLTTDPPQVLRPGGTPFEKLKRFLPNLELNPAALADRLLPLTRIRSPGMKHRHYAPQAKVVLVEGESAAVVGKVKELTKYYSIKGLKVGVLGFDETVRYYRSDSVKSFGSRSNLRAAAHSLFKLLRDFDAERVDIIIAEGTQTTGLGLAVMNRLRRASEYRIVRV